MTLIRCSDDCIYQKDGYCTNEYEKLPQGTAVLSLNNGCLYYTPKTEGELSAANIK